MTCPEKLISKTKVIFLNESTPEFTRRSENLI